MKAWTQLAMLSALSALPLIATSASASPERLQGAWANNGVTCEETFVQRRGKVALRKKFGETWPGFIVDGRHVRGARANCSRVNAKQNGDVMTFLLSCANDIIFETMSVSVRFVDADTIVRFDPAFPEIETTYNRCFK